MVGKEYVGRQRISIFNYTINRKTFLSTFWVGGKRKDVTDKDLFQPKTDLFSTHALIWVQFKTLHSFSQPNFSLFLYLKTHNTI